MYSLTFTTVFVTLLAIVIADQDLPVHDLRQLPYHVNINCNSGRKCGGTILNEQWVLTSAKCVNGSSRLVLNFGMKNENDFEVAYHTLSMISDHIIPYPTDFDDLALVKLPVKLVSSDLISPVVTSGAYMEALRNKLAVLPGSDESDSLNYNTLKYILFNIVDANVCKKKLETYDENYQICTEGWGFNPNTPCDSDFGSGLVVGWPSEPELVGIYSMYSENCDAKIPAVYTFVPKYITWINNMIQE